MISITRWMSHDQPVGRRRTICVDDLFCALARPVAAPSKAALPAWAPVTFRGDRRQKANVEAVYAIGLDIDGGDTAAAVKAWEHVWGCWHTTPSSTPDAPRVRIVSILARPVDCADAERLIAWAQRRTPGKVDRAAKDASRLWYLPWADAAHFVCGILDGAPLDPDPILAQLDAEERAVTRPAPVAREGGPGDVLDRAGRWLDRCSPSIQGNNGSSALWWAAMCLTRGFALDVDTAMRVLVERYNPRCLPAWSRQELLRACVRADAHGEMERGSLLNAARRIPRAA